MEKRELKLIFFVERTSACRDGFEFYAESASEKKQLVRVIIFIFVYALICSDFYAKSAHSHFTRLEYI